ncbi:MAG: 50S ribosomal protein L11 methyltransferase [Chloroflexi bacterium]|nr:50S ribosomal protein L11 methyltransferase [Chloroflexota bacterium]
MSAMNDDSIRWVQIAVRAVPADVDMVADVLSAFAPDGVAIHPAIRIDEGGEFAYEELPEPSTVTAAVRAPFVEEERRRLEAALTALPLAEALTTVAYIDVDAHDWAEEWKRFYTLQRIGRRLVVHPSWEPYEPAPGEAVVALDPGAAFGTGQHETTRLCLAGLEAHVRAGDEVLDVGAGSGVLAIAALKLGARAARALDVDAATVEVARENARRNGVDAALEAAPGSLGDDWPWPGTPPVACADVVVANISAPTVIALMPALAMALRPGGVLIASGFIARDAAAVLGRAEASDLAVVAVAEDGDWRCLIATRGGERTATARPG